MTCIWLVIGACTCSETEAPAPTTEAVVATSPSDESSANEATTERHAGADERGTPAGLRREPIVDPARTRTLRQEVAELRRLVGAGDVATAAPRFVALANREAGNARLHCEAGFVALRAGDRAAAETQIEAGLAVFRRRAGVESEADRVPYAMCLYNRGRLAQEDGDRFLAITSYRASLTRRPNATVQARLAEAEAMPEEEEEEVEEEEVTSEVTRTPVAGSDAARRAEIVHTTLPDLGVEDGCFQDSVVVHDAVAGELEVPLVSACPDTFSIFRDEGHVAESTWVDAGAPYGRVFRVEAHYGGRGDAEDGSGLEYGSSTTLFVLAVIDGAWKVAEIPLESWRESDCMNEPCDDPDTTEDDDQDLREPYAHHFRLVATLAAGALTLRLEDEAGEMVHPPVGRTPLPDVFVAWPWRAP